MRITILGTFHEMENVRAGDVVEVPDHEGARYCSLGYAEPVDSRGEDVETRDEPKRRRTTKATE